MTIRWPTRTSAARSVASAWIPPSQIAAASPKLIPAGLCASGPRPRRQMNSAWPPKPGALPNTWSPTLNSVTAAPTSSTSPASSTPSVRHLGRRRPAKKRQKNGRAARAWVSVWVTVVAWIRMRTWSSPGTGRSTSSTRRTSGGPYRSWTTALMGSRPLAGSQCPGFLDLATLDQDPGREDQFPEVGDHDEPEIGVGIQVWTQGGDCIAQSSDDQQDP